MKQYHLCQSTDVTRSDSVQTTIDKIRKVYRDIGGCVPTPDIVVNSAGRLPKACLTTTLPVSSILISMNQENFEI